MSTRTGLADYRSALTAPGARGPVLFSLLARMPIAMIGLAMLLYVRTTTGSFGTAGLVSAAVLLGVASGSVAQGRVIDRFGPTRPLLTVTVVFAVSVAAAVVAVQLGAATPVLVVIGFVTGLSEPAVGAASRSTWGRLVPPGPVRQAALAYEAISMEVFFILGPALAGVLLYAPWAGTGVVVGAVLMVMGGTGFALTDTVRSWGPAPAGTVRSRGLGALGTPGMRTLAVAALGFGVVIGFVEVGVPAVTAQAGRPALSGLMLSLWSMSSVAFGVFYSTRPWPRPMHLRLPFLLAAFALLVPLLAVPSSLWGLAVALLLVGTMITPQSTAHSSTIDSAAPAGTHTEAFGWIITAVTLGLAGGQSVAGQLVERVGTDAVFVSAGVAGLAVAAVVAARRATLVQAEAPAAPATAVTAPAAAPGGAPRSLAHTA
ncbi:MFS transporter [Rhodococcus antarcticus]|uniref:MFS transporter n=1 Tax=Rhodococcus antarcticus TaxID=2987751 RepID=A0ABY6NZT5_9NOCA|nr:MFS transporter [Rhodococcus antarcticus]UZJ24478.1 MFS transporter [Rhodococcus antarcticus]